MGRRFLFTCIIVVLTVVLLPVSVLAQDGDAPQRTGFRPDAPPYGVRGPYTVGTMEFDINILGRDSVLTVWYPTQGDADAAYTYTLDNLPGWPPLEIYGRAGPDADGDMADAPYPLVIFSHSGGGYRLGSVYFVEHLASYGFVVMAASHIDAGGPPDVPIHHEMVRRPPEISWQIDFAETLTGSDEALEGMIDIDRVAVIGHSSGGYAALAIAGAQYDLEYFRTLCDEYPELDPFGICPVILDNTEDMAAFAGLDAVPDGLWPSYGDPRVDVIVPLALPGRYFNLDSVSEVTIPFMTLTGNMDLMVDPSINTYPVYESLNNGDKTLVVFEDAGHMFFTNTCDTVPWAEAFELSWMCMDSVWDMARAHDLIDHFVTAFLLAELYGDADAAAALSLDAVQFPGITYETTGF